MEIILNLIGSELIDEEPAKCFQVTKIHKVDELRFGLCDGVNTVLSYLNYEYINNDIQVLKFLILRN